MAKAKDDDLPEWIGGQGEREGKPALIRARKFAKGEAPMKALPHLMVIDVEYECFDDTGLPAREQYKEAETFEAAIFDALDARGLLKLVFAEIGCGQVRYFTYVRAPEDVLQHIRRTVNPQLKVAISAGEDPAWSEYQRRFKAAFG